MSTGIDHGSYGLEPGKLAPTKSQFLVFVFHSNMFTVPSLHSGVEDTKGEKQPFHHHWREKLCSLHHQTLLLVRDSIFGRRSCLTDYETVMKEGNHNKRRHNQQPSSIYHYHTIMASSSSSQEEQQQQRHSSCTTTTTTNVFAKALEQYGFDICHGPFDTALYNNNNNNNDSNQDDDNNRTKGTPRSINGMKAQLCHLVPMTQSTDGGQS